MVAILIWVNHSRLVHQNVIQPINQTSNYKCNEISIETKLNTKSTQIFPKSQDNLSSLKTPEVLKLAMAMAFKLTILLLLSSIALQTRAETRGSAVFYDGPNQKFIRSNSKNVDGQGSTLSENEVAATVSVLLGSAPVSLPPQSSKKLNEILFPNPFERPRAVFMLEVTGATDFSPSLTQVGNAFSSIVQWLSKADIELSDEDEVFHLEESLSTDCDVSCISQELAYLGEISARTSELQKEVLTFPLASGSSLNLNLAKKSDLNFALSLVSLTRTIKKAIENHEALAESSSRPAEFLIGRFTGIEALEEEYGSGENVKQGKELLAAALAKLFELLQKSFEGKIVGAVLSYTESSANLGSMLNVAVTAHSPRILAETGLPDPIKIAEVILVRTTLAWTTGIILLLSTLIGIWYLLYMPLTRDTLLYSNVKLD